MASFLPDQITDRILELEENLRQLQITLRSIKQQEQVTAQHIITSQGGLNELKRLINTEVGSIREN